MLCPHCKIPLKKFKSPIGLIFVCPTCDGRASNFYIFKKTCEKSVFLQMTRSLIASDVKGFVKCPSCQKSMNEVSINLTDQFLLIDVCRTCMFIWFDSGEFEMSAAKDPSLIYQEDIPKQTKWQPSTVPIRMGSYDHENLLEVSGWRGIIAYLGMPIPKEELMKKDFPLTTMILLITVSWLSCLGLQNIQQAATDYGLIPKYFFSEGYYRWFTSFFFHGDIFHLLGNMYFLLFFGMAVEDYLGFKKYLLVIMGATFLGSLFHVIGNPSSKIPCIGASGGISGILAYYGLQFRNSKVYFPIRISNLYAKIFEINAIYFFCFWIFLQLFGVIKQLSGVSSVSALAHIGGALFGGLFWWYHRKRG